MKRYMIFFAICSCLISCVVERADKPTREQYSLEAYASESTDLRVEFPLAMMETAFNIETYENATAEEKVRMTYIFNSLLPKGESYYMKNFHSFYLTPDGKSIHEPGAMWQVSACNSNWYSSYGSHLTVACVKEGEWAMSVSYDEGQISFTITQLPSDGSLFNWNIRLSGEVVSGQGRVMKIYTTGDITRKVCVSEWDCTTCMEGSICFDVYDTDAVTLLDAYVYTFDGKIKENQYYSF